jgi:hypothetical protein
MASATPVAALLLLLPSVADADRRFRDLDEILRLIERNSAVAQFEIGPRRSGAVAPIPGATARVLAERGGRLLFSFTDAPTSPVVVRRQYEWNEPVLRMVQEPTAFCPSHDFRRFRYALVRLAPEWSELAPALASVMAPEGRVVGQAGEWILFESTLEVASPVSGDVPLPAPRPESIGDRLGRLMQK